MSSIGMKAYAETGLVDVATVNELLAYGQPMVTDNPWAIRRYRGWLRFRPHARAESPHNAHLREPCHCASRVFGPPDLSPQLAAESLLRKLRGPER